MAALVIAAAGAAAGSALGWGMLGMSGGAVGWMAGSILGSFVGPTQKSSGPRLTDLKVSAAELGAAVPYIIGHPRVSGYIAWASEMRPIATTTRQGKGGGAEYTNYTYEVDLLILLSANVIAGIRRIWSNGKLVWSVADASDAESIEASEDTTTWRAMRFYGGAADQLPDPIYEAAVGVGNAPAFRGRGTVMLEGLQLGSSGQLPNLTFEIANAPANTGETLFYMPFSESGAYDDVEPDPLDYTLLNPDRMEFISGGGLKTGYDEFEHPICGPVAVDGAGVQYSGPKLSTALSLEGEGPLTIDFAIELEALHTNACAQYPEYNVRAFSLDGFGDYLTIGYRVIAEGTTVTTIQLGLGGVLAEFIQIPLTVGEFRIIYDASRPYVGVLTRTEDDDRYTQLFAFSGRSLAVNRFILGGFSAGGVAYDYVFRYVHGYYPPDREGVPNVPVPLPDVVAALCARCGLGADDIDVSDLAGQMVHAMAVQPTSARGVLEQLATAYYFECRESDKLYFVRRGGAPVATIPYADYGADGLLTIQDANDLEQPAQVNVSYLNLSNAYQQGNEVSDRLTTDSTAVANVQLGMGLTPAAAKAIADTAVLDLTIAARSATATLDMRYAALECCDVVLLEDVAGITHRMRITKISDASGVRSLDLSGDDARILRELGITSNDYDDDYTVLRLADTDLVVLDIPLLRDQDDAPSLYAAGDGLRGRWPGYVLLRDGVEVGRASTGAAMGVVIEALGDWTSLLVDEAHVLTVTVNPGDELASITHDDLSTGTANVAAIGAPGRWEVVQYQRAVLVSEGVYRLSGLARGRLGTEHLRGTHQAGDRFVALDGAGLLRDVGNLADLGMERDYIGVTQGARIESGAEVQVTPTWQALRPLSPVGARQLKQANGDISLQWGRRSRYVSNVLMGILPLAEAAERYEVDVLDGSGAVVRTLAGTTPTLTYTSAQQTEDFGAPQASVAAQIYQISEAVGRGAAAYLPLANAPALGVYAREVLADAPVLYWRCDESAGTVAADASGHGRNALYRQDAAVLTTAGLIASDTNAAVALAAGATVQSGLYFAGATVDFAGSWGFEALIRPDGVGILAQMGVPVGGSRYCEINVFDVGAGRFALRVMHSGFAELMLTAATWPYGQAMHVFLLQVAGGDLQLYADGVLVGGAAFNFAGSSGEVRVGCGSFFGTSDTYPFLGVVDEVAMYAGALSPARIAAHAAARAI